jgi:SAM-dependent methyltransferase
VVNLRRQAVAAEITDWNSVYRYLPYSENAPHREVVLLENRFCANGLRRILDLGCGDGRHLVFFAQRGYRAYGLDIAPWGVRRAKEWLTRERLEAGVVCGDMLALPWPDGALDAVFSIQVIYHGQLASIRRTLDEVYRILCDRGLFFATLLKYPPVGRRIQEFEEIEPRTYVRMEGFEKGLSHHFFIQGELEDVLHSFDLLRLDESSDGKYFNVLAQKPSR